MNSQNETLERVHKAFRQDLTDLLSNREIAVLEPEKPEIVVYKNIGGVFSNSLVVKHAEEKEKRRIEVNADISAANTLVQFYKNTKYPLITYGQVLSLCEKWDLFLAPSKRYIGDIPEKNAVEIDKYHKSIEPYSRRRTEEVGYKSPVFQYPTSDNGTHGGYFVCATADLINFKSATVIGRELYEAPASKIFNPPTPRNMDPVVLKHVGIVGGVHLFHVVTMWGDEASDLMLQRGKDN